MSKVTSAGLSTFASGFDVPTALGFDSAGNLYVVNAGNNTVTKVTPTGQKSTFASGFNQPVGLTVDPAGDLYVANLGDNTVSEVTAAGSISTLASGLAVPLACVRRRNLYVANDGNNTVSEVSETVTVPFALSGAAAAGVAFSGLTAGPLMFGIGQTTQFIAGTLLSDPGAQTLTFTLGTPAGGAVLGSAAVNTLTINEPTAVGTPTPTPTSLTPVFKGEQRVFSGKGKHKKLVGFEFLFNGAAQPKWRPIDRQLSCDPEARQEGQGAPGQVRALQSQRLQRHHLGWRLQHRQAGPGRHRGIGRSRRGGDSPDHLGALTVSPIPHRKSGIGGGQVFRTTFLSRGQCSIFVVRQHSRSRFGDRRICVTFVLCVYGGFFN